MGRWCEILESIADAQQKKDLRALHTALASAADSGLPHRPVHLEEMQVGEDNKDHQMHPDKGGRKNEFMRVYDANEFVQADIAERELAERKAEQDIAQRPDDCQQEDHEEV